MMPSRVTLTLFAAACSVLLCAESYARDNFKCSSVQNIDECRNTTGLPKLWWWSPPGSDDEYKIAFSGNNQVTVFGNSLSDQYHSPVLAGGERVSKRAGKKCTTRWMNMFIDGVLVELLENWCHAKTYRRVCIDHSCSQYEL